MPSCIANSLYAVLDNMGLKFPCVYSFEQRSQDSKTRHPIFIPIICRNLRCHNISLHQELSFGIFLCQHFQPILNSVLVAWPGHSRVKVLDKFFEHFKTSKLFLVQDECTCAGCSSKFISITKSKLSPKDGFFKTSSNAISSVVIPMLQDLVLLPLHFLLDQEEY